MGTDPVDHGPTPPQAELGRDTTDGGETYIASGLAEPPASETLRSGAYKTPFHAQAAPPDVAIILAFVWGVGRRIVYRSAHCDQFPTAGGVRPLPRL